MLGSQFSHAQLPKNFSGIGLTDLAGNPIQLASQGQKKATVFYYLAPECPLCINYSKNIREIAAEFEPKGVQFYGVFPGKLYSKEEIESYLSEYQVTIPILLDANYELAKAMKAKITPEVFVYDAQARLKYQGKIDNWIVKLGKKRTVVTEFYLTDALNAILEGTAIPVTQTEAVGCLIEYR
jgi:peroxiredoxin